MKSFVTIIQLKTNRKYGGQECVATHYRIKKNRMINLGTNEYSTRSMRGHDHEAANWLSENKKIPKSWLRRGGYIDYKKADRYNLKVIRV